MRKNKLKPTTPSSDNATTATILSQPLKPEQTNTAPTAIQEEPSAQSAPEVNALTETSDDRIRERLAKLEVDINRLGQVVMQVVNYMEKGPNSQQPIVNVNTPATPGGGGGFNLGSILPEIIKAAGNMLGPSQPAADPFQMEVYKGMVESFKEGFKSYIQTVNQNAQIGAEVVKAIQKGSLKLETASGGTPTA